MVVFTSSLMRCYGYHRLLMLDYKPKFYEILIIIVGESGMFFLRVIQAVALSCYSLNTRQHFFSSF